MLLTVSYNYWSGEDDEDESGEWIQSEIDLNPFLIESVCRDASNKKGILVTMQSGTCYSVNMTRLQFHRALKQYMAENMMQKIYDNLKGDTN